MARPKRVVQATQSPLNEKRWLVKLEGCGHEWWITANKRPMRVKCTSVECCGGYANDR